MRKYIIFIIASILLLISPVLANGAIYYVNKNAIGVNDGSSWIDAFVDLQDALGTVSSGDEIWVAKGTYYPTTAPEIGGSGDHFRSFQLVNDVSIYGGFAGTEISLNERDFETNTTILSGDDFYYHVFNHYGTILDSSAVLDGFTITGGNAAGIDRHGWAGGMYNDNGSSPTIINCTFINNIAATHGGGMVNIESSPTITNCIFIDNTAGEDGGGIGNKSNSSPEITNCIFMGNEAGDTGGAMCNSDFSYPALTNCNFIDNIAGKSGGGIQNEMSSSPTLRNCIMWGDMVTGSTNNPEIGNTPSSSSTISYCDIEGCNGSGSSWNTWLGVDGGNNIDADPMFITGELHLVYASPCVDAGDPSSSGGTDIDGENRIIDGNDDGMSVVDMGADEYLDSDQDNLPDVWEIQNGLDPNNSDTDGNGTEDGDEDLDGDGIINLYELNPNLDPGNNPPPNNPPPNSPSSNQTGSTGGGCFINTLSTFQ